MSKVFCKNCAYFEVFRTMESESVNCNYPDNIKEFDEIDWRGKTHWKLPDKKPSEINSHNDCSWWEKKSFLNYHKRAWWL